MPYITAELRKPIAAVLDNAKPRHWGCGQLAYAVYRLMKAQVGETPSFIGYATVVGAVLLTVARFVQKEVFKYEDVKEAENGGIE